MKSLDEFGTETADRRAKNRRAASGNIKLFVETRELQGKIENVSQTGVLFFSEGELRVTVEIEENGKTRRVQGRLVRAQKMNADSIGWAIEFDPA